MRSLLAIAAFYVSLCAGVDGLIQNDWSEATAWAVAAYWSLLAMTEWRGQ